MGRPPYGNEKFLPRRGFSLKCYSTVKEELWTLELAQLGMMPW